MKCHAHEYKAIHSILHHGKKLIILFNQYKQAKHSKNSYINSVKIGSTV